MHLVFERSTGRFKSNCNILALAWMPYYNETKFRLALFDYHQRQLINLTSNNNINNNNINEALSGSSDTNRDAHNSRDQSASGGETASQRPSTSSFLNSRLIELYQRHSYLKKAPNHHRKLKEGEGEEDNARNKRNNITSDLDAHYGRMPDFGWLVIGNVGKIVGVTLTSTVAPLPQTTQRVQQSNRSSTSNDEEDLMQFHETESNTNGDDAQKGRVTIANNVMGDTFRPDQGNLRNNYNLRGHLDEIILVKWNELYQKLATIDSKGNVLIWCKINEKFTIQTPFYNRTKSVADFKWSNDGKTALICYTDSFILVGSSSGQRHWHSMLNLDDYHITCASWTPNDEQLLLGVSNGNVVVIDLPRSELTELVVNQTNIRTMCWSSSDLSLSHLSQSTNETQHNQSTSPESMTSASFARGFTNSERRHSQVVHHRRLSRDCSVFSRYRFCSQGPNNVSARSPPSDLTSSSGVGNSSTLDQTQSPRIFTFPRREENNKFTGGGDNSSSFSVTGSKQQRNILAIDFANNTIKLYDGGLDDPDPRTIQVNQESYIMHWSSDGKCLAVAGFNIHTTAPSVGCLRCRYLNAIKFYDQCGQLIYEHTISYTRYPITAFTWAHDDKRLFVATGPRLHCAKVFMGIPPLSLLAVSCFQRYTKIPDKGDILDMIVEDKFISSNVLSWQSHNCPINLSNSLTNQKQPTTLPTSPDKLIFAAAAQGTVEDDETSIANKSTSICHNSNVYSYQLPLKLQIKIDNLFTQTIRQPFDEHWSLNDIIWHVPNNEQRYYCTLVCYTSDRDINSSGYQYRTNLIDRNSDNHTSDQNKIFVLYLEFQGSLIPILRARRVGFLKPEFVIFDPEENQAKLHRQRKVSDISQQSSYLDVGFLQRRLDLQTNSNYQNQQQSINSGYGFNLYSNNQQYPTTPYQYSNEGFADNCSELHLYSDPRASSSSLGRQSMSDAEHYYNFDGNAINPHKQTPTHSNRMLADLVSERSHHQEPIALPMSGNPYLMYMMSLTANQLQNGRSNLIQQSPMMSCGTKTGKRDLYKLKNSTSSSASGNLTESNELVRIKSNIWGTKFKLINVGNRMIKQRSILGSVAYKASILHLQPRQIFLTIKDMSNYCCLCSKHHHTRRTTRQNNQPKQQQQPQQQHKRRQRSINSHNNVSLMDMPNFETQPQVTTPVAVKGKRALRRNGSLQDFNLTETDRIESKVVLPVGDSIRIAPTLEINQRYRFVQSGIDDPIINQLRGEARLYFDRMKSRKSKYHGKNNFVEPQKNSSEKRRRKRKNKADKGETSVPREDPIIYRYPLSATHSSSRNYGTESPDDRNRSYVNFKPHQSSSLSGQRDAQEQQDDILTLSLDQGDQVKVEMSSLRNLQDAHQRTRSQAGGKRDDLDKFLATNKTLKSIQSITKMIVDLSSKADDLEITGSQITSGDQQPSPSKVARLSNEHSPLDHNQPTTSSARYVAPETPVHRPRRRVASRANSQLGNNNNINTNQQVPDRTRSATSTPLKSFTESNRSSRKHKLDGKLTAQVSNPLPPPPPSIPIGRRLSSSAKRFIDGSLRSLYGGGSYSASDAEPEETELLVTERTFRAKLVRDLLKHPPPQSSVGRSQPCTPVKRSNSGKHSSFNDMSTNLRAQLMYRLRGEKSNNNYSSSSSRHANKFSVNQLMEPGRSGWHYRNKGSLNTSGSPSSSSGSSSSSSNSESSSSSNDDSDSDDDAEFDMTDSEFDDQQQQQKMKQKSAFKTTYSGFSASVKDLRDFGRLGKFISGGGDGHSKGRRKHSGRSRRKSMCPNSSCCCAKEFKLNNRPPVWNELSQVYQLDFGGRVTQESAKNLQIDFDGKLALQFGRIDRCTYTLDYKYPFNAVQAMAIALASLTQRLK